MILETSDDQLMMFAAFRYCLGRRTYIVSTCVEWIRQHWDQIEPTSQMQIGDEIRDAINNGYAGMGMDVADWELLLERVGEAQTGDAT